MFWFERVAFGSGGRFEIPNAGKYGCNRICHGNAKIQFCSSAYMIIRVMNFSFIQIRHKPQHAALKYSNNTNNRASFSPSASSPERHRVGHPPARKEVAEPRGCAQTSATSASLLGQNHLLDRRRNVLPATGGGPFSCRRHLILNLARANNNFRLYFYPTRLRRSCRSSRSASTR